MGNGITEVFFEKSWGHSPARINRHTGETHINEDYLPIIKSNDHWYYILAHEDTHRRKNTMSEFVADEGASELYFKDKRSPRNSVTALANVLSFTNPDHIERVRAQFIRAAKYDCATNGHKASCDMMADTEKKRNYDREFNFADFCGPVCRRKQRKLNAAVANALSNNTVVTTAVNTAVTNAVTNQQQQGNIPAPSAQQQSPTGPTGGGGGGPSSPDDGGGDDGSDDGSFNGYAFFAGLDNKNDISAFCGPFCQSAKAKNERKEQESSDKKTVALAQADAATKQAEMDNAQKKIEAQAAAEQTDAVAKSLSESSKSENKGGNMVPVIAGVLLLVAVGVFLYLKSKKKKVAP